MSPVIVTLDPVPLKVPPGVCVSVHVPVPGRLPTTTLPDELQVGCVTVPMEGIEITVPPILALPEEGETQLPEVTVKVYVPAISPVTR